MNLAHRVSTFNRKRKWDTFLRMIPFDKNTKLLDIGYSDIEYTPTENYLEKHYPYLHNVTALGIDEPKLFPLNYPEVTVVEYDGVLFPFNDSSFDIGWSNAVLEHVGYENEQVQFVKELSRVAKIVFMTTPNRFFPIELHTKLPLVHFLPDYFFHPILKLTRREWFIGDRLLSRRTLKKVLEKAGIKQYTILSNRLAFFVLDFVVVFAGGQL